MRLKARRAAAVDAHRRPLGHRARIKQREKGDEQSQADQERHPASADGRQVKLKAELAIASRRIRMVCIVLRQLRTLMLLQMGLKVQILQQAGAKGHKT